MKPVVALVRDGWADWEAGFLLGVTRYFVGADTRIATPDGRGVHSTGGLRIDVDLAFPDVDPGESSALALIGGPGWSEPDAGVSRLLRVAAGAGIPIGGICAATIPLARAGLLDSRAHTSNGPGYLDREAPGYRGGARYCDQPAAVVDQGVVTAPGTAPTSFAVLLLRLAFPESAGLLNELLVQAGREHAVRP
ncbi:MAG: DJ-1/PfpI family protein [Gemmatimonadales bacterium]